MKPLLPDCKSGSTNKINLMENNLLITDSKLVAKTLNDYFVNVAGSKDSTSEEFDDHPSVHCIKMKNYKLASKFHTVNEKYIKRILDSLNPKNAVGIDKISSRAIRLSSSVLVLVRYAEFSFALCG